MVYSLSNSIHYFLWKWINSVCVRAGYCGRTCHHQSWRHTPFFFSMSMFPSNPLFIGYYNIVNICYSFNGQSHENLEHFIKEICQGLCCHIVMVGHGIIGAVWSRFFLKAPNLAQISLILYYFDFWWAPRLSPHGAAILAKSNMAATQISRQSYLNNRLGLE